MLDATVRVEAVDREDPPAVDRLSYAIQDGEEWSAALGHNAEKRDRVSDPARVAALTVALVDAIPGDRSDLKQL